MPENVQNTCQNHKLHHECHEKPEGEIDRGRTNPNRGKNSRRHLPRRLTFATAIGYAIMPRNHVFRKCTGGGTNLQNHKRLIRLRI